MPPFVQAPSHGLLRDHLGNQNSKLADAANYTWNQALPIHERQTQKGGNIDGRLHVEEVEKNIWRLLSETQKNFTGNTYNIDGFSPYALYLLSCSVCCHDLDKGLPNEVLGGRLKHGEGSAYYVLNEWKSLGIHKRDAELISWIIRIHDYKEDFEEQLSNLPIPDKFPGYPDLRLLATLLKAADTLHSDESRISRLSVPDNILEESKREKQQARGDTVAWGTIERNIVITASITNMETGIALLKSIRYMTKTEWPPILRSLEACGFPHNLQFRCLCSQFLEQQLTNDGLLPQDCVTICDYPFESQTSETKSDTPRIKALNGPTKFIANPPNNLETHPSNAIKENICPSDLRNPMAYVSEVHQTWIVKVFLDNVFNITTLMDTIERFEQKVTEFAIEQIYHWIKERLPATTISNTYKQFSFEKCNFYVFSAENINSKKDKKIELPIIIFSIVTKKTCPYSEPRKGKWKGKDKIDACGVGKYRIVETICKGRFPINLDELASYLANIFTSSYAWLYEYIRRNFRQFETEVSSRIYSHARILLRPHCSEKILDTLLFAVQSKGRSQYIFDSQAMESVLRFFAKREGNPPYLLAKLFMEMILNNIDFEKSFAKIAIGSRGCIPAKLDDAKYREESTLFELAEELNFNAVDISVLAIHKEN